MNIFALIRCPSLPASPIRQILPVADMDPPFDPET